VAAYNVQVFEGIHLVLTAVAGKNTSVAVTETLTIAHSQLQYSMRSVTETVAATDETDAEKERRIYLDHVAEEIAASDACDSEHVRRDTDSFGTQLIELHSPFGFEKAAADLESGIMLDINAELIIDTWDPWATFNRNLPYLAWAYDANMWEDGWSENTRRAWTDYQHEFKRIRGTIGAIRDILEFAGRDFVGPGGYVLKQYMTPPQMIFASPGLSVEEHNAWIRLMPEIRIYLGIEGGTAGGDMFLDDGFIRQDYIAYDNGWELYGRKAILRQFGKPDIPLRIVQRSKITESHETVDWEEIHTGGFSSAGIFLDEDFVDESNYLDSDDVKPDLYKVRLDRAFDRVSTQLHLSSVRPTQEPISVTYERTSDIGHAGPFMFLDDGILGVHHLARDDAALMLADRIYLLDENIATPMSVGTSFIDVDRLGFPRHTMELLIDLQTYEEGTETWVDVDSTLDHTFLASTNLEHIDRACRAVVAAKSLRDKALCQFDPWRPIESSDEVTEESTAADWVPNNL
jgi:tail protein P2 I